MPQISLYIDEITLKKIENAARRQHISISKWVEEQLKQKVEPIYPEGFEDLFGSISDNSLNRPKEINFDQDANREAL